MKSFRELAAECVGEAERTKREWLSMSWRGSLISIECSLVAGVALMARIPVAASVAFLGAVFFIWQALYCRKMAFHFWRRFMEHRQESLNLAVKWEE